jgi:hypothetical protein
VTLSVTLPQSHPVAPRHVDSARIPRYNAVGHAVSRPVAPVLRFPKPRVVRSSRAGGAALQSVRFDPLQDRLALL